MIDLDRCSFCGGTTARLGATLLEWSTFLEVEAACRPSHELRLVATRTLGSVVRRVPLALARSAA
jgi:hypothetical protein